MSIQNGQSVTEICAGNPVSPKGSGTGAGGADAHPTATPMTKSPAQKRETMITTPNTRISSASCAPGGLQSFRGQCYGEERRHAKKSAGGEKILVRRRLGLGDVRRHAAENPQSLRGKILPSFRCPYESSLLAIFTLEAQPSILVAHRDMC